MRQRKTDRQRQRGRARDRHTDRQTHRQTDRDRQRLRQTDTQTQKGQSESETRHRQTEGSGIQKDRCTPTDRETKDTRWQRADKETRGQKIIPHVHPGDPLKPEWLKHRLHFPLLFFFFFLPRPRFRPFFFRPLSPAWESLPS